MHRPRNVGWRRAAGLLYGDWGTSKAYVIGLAFFYAGYGSLPIIVAVCALTALVGYNYTIVCKHFPDGGGVYSAARIHRPDPSFKVNWQHFVAIILALSGVEAIANLTGVMKLDPGATLDRPQVAKAARKAILPVAAEVVLGTVLLGWAMLSLPPEHAPDPAAQRDCST